jgi:hypothetical protein
MELKTAITQTKESFFSVTVSQIIHNNSREFSKGLGIVAGGKELFGRNKIRPGGDDTRQQERTTYKKNGPDILITCG